ncbi:MAG: hypothetical protein JWO50_24 [Candidatus Kaiserbacteria bacterium]|nr:hypothetical protein [Candidatus Kaiserbacteria bacterium]
MSYTVNMVKTRILTLFGLGAAILLPFALFAQVTSTTTVGTSTTPVATSTAATSTGLAMEDRPYLFLSGPECLVLSRNLSLGKQGADVYALQRELMITGFLRLSDISGVYDATTSVAVIQFQSAYNISNSLSGLVGPLTRAYFKNLCPVVSVIQQIQQIVQTPVPPVVNSVTVPAIITSAASATVASIDSALKLGNVPTPAATPYNLGTLASQISANIPLGSSTLAGLGLNLGTATSTKPNLTASSTIGLLTDIANLLTLQSTNYSNYQAPPIPLGQCVGNSSPDVAFLNSIFKSSNCIQYYQPQTLNYFPITVPFLTALKQFIITIATSTSANGSIQLTPHILGQ